MTFLLGGRCSVLLLVSMASLCCADPNQNCDATAQLNFVGLAHSPVQPVRSTAGSLAPLYNFARSFLEAVQPNVFPKDLIQRAADDEELDASEVARYEAGYVVCLILALLYMFLLPILGGIFTWRHYHGNSGGSTLSSPSSRRHWGITMATCLAATTILLLAGVILAFITNNRTRENMRPSMYHLQSSLGDMGDALSSISEKIDLIVEEYSVPKAAIEKNLNGAGDDIGQTVIAMFDMEAKSALADLSVSVEDAVWARESLQDVDTLRSRMQERQPQLQAQLGELRQGLQESAAACPACSPPSTNQLLTDANYTKIPSVRTELDRLPPAADFTGLVEQANTSFNGIPQICKNQAAPSVKALMADLEETGTSLNASSQQFPSLRSLSEWVSDVRQAVSIYDGYINRYDYQRWAVAVMFCTLILFIVVLTAIGLALGLPSLCYPDYRFVPNQDQLDCVAVTLLRVAVILTLIFSWLFIILVFITLFFGGNAHTLACRSWKSGEIFELLDQYDDLFSSLNVSQSEESSTPPLNLSTADVYHGCKKGRSLFHSMEYSQLFDLQDFLNISKYMYRFRQNGQNMSINLEELQLLSSDGRRNVQRFRDSGIDRIDYDAFSLLLSRPVVKTNLTALATQLDRAAQTQNGNIRTDLESKAGKTREVHALAQQQERDAKSMNRIVKALSLISARFKANINTALKSIEVIQQGLQKPMASIVRNVSQCILQKGETCLDQYLDWVRHAIINEVLGCRWLSMGLDNVYTALCENIVAPWNGFWLCLGWCCAFLIPTLIFSLFTASHLQPATPSFPRVTDASFDYEEKTGKIEPNNYEITLTKITDLGN
ncbi:hypothetical protein SKAU_G00174210 [Synaphobranchus kaupii]|uniref:Prominin-2 n=1 Tax=Synaphobranchus kaupii TaxID=118154 RepID=A0A9Q1FL52_SYNKA|nr:hypothetical protein SKAU_G00174210 [Synaphobranchus kaupii]